MRSWAATVVVLAVVSAACAPATRDVKRTLGASDAGRLAFETDEGVVLTADLRMPDGAGPFPAIVMMHGCSGLPHRAIESWRPVLGGWGFATLVVDSFSARGYREVCTRATAVRPNERIGDAYGALRVVATHPKIDRDRIVLMGFSHGGIVTLGAATAWAAARYRPAGAPAFRAFIAFYPYCNVETPQLLRLAGPLRIHIGALDDWTPATTCVALAQRQRDAGNDVAITVYPGAHHAFDGAGSSVLRVPSVENWAECFPRLERIDGPLLDADELRRCVRRGATSGWNPLAAEAATGNVRAELAELLR